MTRVLWNDWRDVFERSRSIKHLHESRHHRRMKDCLGHWMKLTRESRRLKQSVEFHRNLFVCVCSKYLFELDVFFSVC